MAAAEGARILREDTVRIPAHLNGPPTSGHGGYTSALLAQPLEGAVAVDLRRPIPLDRPLQRRLLEGARTELRDGDILVAEARQTELAVDIPPAPGWQESIEAAGRYPGLRHHPFATCFGCGPQRAEGDGLRIFPGLCAARRELAATWIPHRSIAAADGRVPREMVWAALDCPAGWAMDPVKREKFPDQAAAVTAQLAARIDGAVFAERRYTILSWPVRADGRKISTAAVLYDADGAPLAVAAALMVILMPRT